MAKSLTKTQFLDEYANRLNTELELSLKRKDAGVVIDTLQDLLCEHATDEQGAKIQGFLKVQVLKTKERQGRNPKTGEKITIKPKIRGKIVLLKGMKDRLAEIGEDFFGKSKKKNKEKVEKSVKEEKKTKKSNIIKVDLKKKKKDKSSKKHKKAA